MKNTAMHKCHYLVQPTNTREKLIIELVCKFGKVKVTVPSPPPPRLLCKGVSCTGGGGGYTIEAAMGVSSKVDVYRPATFTHRCYNAASVRRPLPRCRPHLLQTIVSLPGGTHHCKQLLPWDQAPTVPKKNLLCCGMLQVAGGGYPNFPEAKT